MRIKMAPKRGADPEPTKNRPKTDPKPTRRLRPTRKPTRNRPGAGTRDRPGDRPETDPKPTQVKNDKFRKCPNLDVFEWFLIISDPKPTQKPTREPTRKPTLLKYRPENRPENRPETDPRPKILKIPTRNRPETDKLWHLIFAQDTMREFDVASDPISDPRPTRFPTRFPTWNRPDFRP